MVLKFHLSCHNGSVASIFFFLYILVSFFVLMSFGISMLWFLYHTLFYKCYKLFPFGCPCLAQASFISRTGLLWGQLALPTCLSAWVLLGYTAFGYSHQPPDRLLWLGENLHSWWGYDLALDWLWEKTSFRASKNPHLKIQIRQVCTPSNSLVRVYH